MFKSLKIMKFEEIENFELCKLLFCVKEKTSTCTNTQYVSYTREKTPPL